MCRKGISILVLQELHKNHKYMLMSNDQLRVKEFVALLAGKNQMELNVLASEYLDKISPRASIYPV
jgi:uncharacterized protein YbgA (DUF1722 family)